MRVKKQQAIGKCAGELRSNLRGNIRMASLTEAVLGSFFTLIVNDLRVEKVRGANKLTKVKRQKFTESHLHRLLGSVTLFKGNQKT